MVDKINPLTEEVDIYLLEKLMHYMGLLKPIREQNLPIVRRGRPSPHVLGRNSVIGTVLDAFV